MVHTLRNLHLESTGFFKYVWPLVTSRHQSYSGWAFSRLLTDGGVWQKGLLPKICHTYPAMMKLGAVIHYLKKIQKIYESCGTPLEFCWHQYFFTGNQQILIYQEIQIQIAVWYIISHSYNFFESLKIVLINMVTILMILPNIATLGLLELKIFWNNGYDILTSVHDVTNKIFLGESNYIVAVIMWPKFGNTSISMREVIITSIL